MSKLYNISIQKVGRSNSAGNFCKKCFLRNINLYEEFPGPM